MTRFGEVSLRGDGRLRGKRKHPGMLALHVAVDDHSRMAFTQMLPHQKAETTIGFLNSAVEFFATHGIGVRALLTDNGASYRSTPFRQGLPENAHRTSPHKAIHPENQRQSRALIQTALGERAYAKHWSLQPWPHYYNHRRPHGSLHYKPPISRSDSGTTS